MKGVLPATGAVAFVAIALTESFALLPVAIAAYAAAWWVLRLEHLSTRPTTRVTKRQGDRR